MISKFSNFQWAILLIYSVVNILLASCVSIQGPFYPIVAETKGAISSEYGIVFAAYSVVLLFVSPLSGLLINKFGAVKISFLGIIISGITSIMFAFVDKINGIIPFISVSIIIRVAEGVGCGMVRNSAVAIITFEFSSSPEIAFSIVETFFSAGFMIGPLAGGALFELGGFYLPFTLLGILLLCISPVHKFLPRGYKKYESELSKDILKILQQPSVILGIFIVFGACFNISFVIFILEPHVKNLNLSPVQVGSVFLCNGIAFVSFFFCSLSCDKYRNTLFISSLSAFILMCGLLLLGPAPYLLFDMNLYTCIFGLIIHGIGAEGELVSGYSLLNRGVSNAGLTQSIQTSGFISTLYISSYAFGTFTGPLLGGYIFDAFDFPWGSHLYILYHLVLCIVMITYQCVLNSCTNKRKSSNHLSAAEITGKH